MKNSIKICVLVIALVASASCIKQQPSTASFSLTTTFELRETDYDTYLVDSLMYTPEFSMDEINYFFSRCLGMNSGYEGGFKLSIKKGVDSSDDPYSYFTSAGSSAGALSSLCYLGYLQTSIMPEYDVKFNFSNYSKGSSQVLGCYITNSAYTIKLYEQGEIKSGDYLKVTMEFFRNGNSIGSWSKYLVDGINKVDPDVITDWEPWDIGTETSEKNLAYADIDAVRINVETSGGKLVPCFCMDNFTVQVNVEY